VERQKTSNIIFGEAAAFYEILLDGCTHIYAVYHALVERDEIFSLYPRGRWDPSFRAVNSVWIRDIVGTWKLKGADSPRTYVLRKHPGLALLTPEELGLPEKSCGVAGESQSGSGEESADDSSELDEPFSDSEGSSDEGLYLSGDDL
jgi:hypothetical protein